MNAGRVKILFLIAACLAAGFILFGIFRGEVSIVFQKAVNICLECIGLGR